MKYTLINFNALYLSINSIFGGIICDISISTYQTFRDKLSVFQTNDRRYLSSYLKNVQKQLFSYEQIGFIENMYIYSWCPYFLVQPTMVCNSFYMLYNVFLSKELTSVENTIYFRSSCKY